MIANCLVCNKEFKTKPFAIKRGRGKYCSKSCYGIAKSQMMTGKGNPQFGQHWTKGSGNPNWKGGICRLPYTFDFDLELRSLIRRRDGHKCTMCGCPQEEQVKALSVHHIDENKSNNNPANLTTICNACHCKVHEPHRTRQGGDVQCTPNEKHM